MNIVSCKWQKSIPQMQSNTAIMGFKPIPQMQSNTAIMGFLDTNLLLDLLLTYRTSHYRLYSSILCLFHKHAKCSSPETQTWELNCITNTTQFIQNVNTDQMRTRLLQLRELAQMSFKSYI